MKTKQRNGECTMKTKADLLKVILYLEACAEATEWVTTHESNDACVILLDCPRGDWLLWLGSRLGADRKNIVSAACQTARTVLQYVEPGEDRPRLCIEMTEAWVQGEATIEQVRKSRNAAYEAYTAATSATAKAAAFAASSAYYDAAFSAASAAYDAASAAMATTTARVASSVASVVYAASSVASAACVVPPYTAQRAIKAQKQAEFADIVRAHLPWAMFRDGGAALLASKAGSK